MQRGEGSTHGTVNPCARRPDDAKGSTRGKVVDTMGAAGRHMSGGEANIPQQSRSCSLFFRCAHVTAAHPGYAVRHSADSPLETKNNNRVVSSFPLMGIQEIK